MNLILLKEKINARHDHNARNGAGAFDKHEGHTANIFKIKFWVSFVLSIPIIFYSDIAQKLLDYTAPLFFGSGYLPFILASLVFSTEAEFL